jgi:SAM-dependent methyltransferase
LSAVSDSSTLDATASLLKSLADPGRIAIARLLLSGTFNVGELTEVLGAGQSTISRNLRILMDAGLLDARKEGRQSWYSWRAGLPASQRALKDWVAEHAPDLDTSTGRRVQDVWESRRLRSAAFFDSVDPTDASAAWLGSSDCVPALLEQIGKAACVLDLGTGSGRLLPGLAARATTVIGVDASPALLEEARRRTADLPAESIDLRLGDMAHLPVGNGEVDVVVANMVLHHLPEPARVFPEIRRVLRPGGALLIGEFLPHSEEWMRESLADQWLGLPPADLTDWLDEAGFGSVDIQPLPLGRPGALGVFVARAIRPQS